MRVLLLLLILTFEPWAYGYGDCTQTADEKINSCVQMYSTQISYSNSVAATGSKVAAKNKDDMPGGGSVLNGVGTSTAGNLDKAADFCVAEQDECVKECKKAEYTAEHLAPPDEDAADRAKENSRRCAREITSVIANGAPSSATATDAAAAGLKMKKTITNN